MIKEYHCCLIQGSESGPEHRLNYTLKAACPEVYCLQMGPNSLVNTTKGRVKCLNM